jgi:hypothetical protein
MSDGCPDQVARRFLRLSHRRASVGAMVGDTGCVGCMAGTPSPSYECRSPATVPYLGWAAVLPLRGEPEHVHIARRHVQCSLNQCQMIHVGLLLVCLRRHRAVSRRPVGQPSGADTCLVAMCQCQLDNVHVQHELVQLHMYGGTMSSYLLWSGLAAVVPVVLVVLGVAFGLRALKHARATRLELARLDHLVLAARHVGHSG